ncbi:MAG: helix-turn-helix domain-containing protein [Gemmatimonadaceae bacterium]
MQLLRIPEVAKALNISPEHAYELARSDILPVVRLGRQLRVNPSALAEWVERGGKALPGGWRRVG